MTKLTTLFWSVVVKRLPTTALHQWEQIVTLVDQFSSPQNFANKIQFSSSQSSFRLTGCVVVVMDSFLQYSIVLTLLL